MENFIVSARKYRPATFASVVGQNHITSTLRNAIERGQLAHAYLFCGPRGVGKTTCARIFAKAINCMAPREGAEACGECASCRGFDEGRSFNIHELDAASNNSVEDIRNLTDQVRIPPQLGRYSVYIIDEVHMLSAAAFNAFLKTLEEPPAHAVFILATTEKHKIIPTILSRCQIFDFNRIKVADGVEYMRYIANTEGVTCDEESLNLIARKADGGMRDALSMFDKAVSFCGNSLRYKEVAASLNVLDHDTYFGVVDVVLAGDYAAALMAFDGVLAAGFSAQTFMAGLADHLRDLLVARNRATAPLLDVTGPLLARYTEQAAKASVGFLFDGVALLGEMDARIRTSTNQRLTVELTLMKLCRLANDGFAIEVAGNEAVSGQGEGPAEKKKYDPLAAENAPLPTLRRVNGGTIGADSGVATTPAGITAVSTETPKVEAVEPARSTPEVSVKQKTEKRITPTIKTSFSGISGRSLTEIMSGTSPETTTKAQVVQAPVDPDAQNKIERHKEKFLAKLLAQRPRIGVVYETMEVAGNVVSVRVASSALKEEVLRQRAETLGLLAVMAGVQGPIEVEITVDETMKAARPFRVEDRVNHLGELNPLFNELRRVLDMEAE